MSRPLDNRDDWKSQEYLMKKQKLESDAFVWKHKEQERKRTESEILYRKLMEEKSKSESAGSSQKKLPGPEDFRGRRR